MKIRLLFPCVLSVMVTGGCSKVLFCGCVFLSKEFIIFHTNFSIWVALLLFYCMGSVVSLLKCLRDMQGEVPARAKCCRYLTQSRQEGDPSCTCCTPQTPAWNKPCLQLCRRWDSASCTQTDFSWSAGSTSLLWGTHSRCEAFFSTISFSTCELCFRQ